MNNIGNTVIIGSGNVANFLAHRLYAKGLNIHQIISRNTVTGRILADAVSAGFREQYIPDPKVDLVLLCVPDNQIEFCADRIKDANAIMCHCAGSIGMDTLKGFVKHGVLYPLQSFSDQAVQQSQVEVPFLVEASSEDVLLQLKGLLEYLGYGAVEATSIDRLKYHLAAVFTNNFTNAMMLAAQEIIHENRLDASLLRPLLLQTFEKLKIAPAVENQTGPAKRHDLITLRKHLDLLKDNDRLMEVYKSVSDFISSKFKH